MLERQAQRDANRPLVIRKVRDTGHGTTPQRREKAGADAERVVIQTVINGVKDTVTTERMVDGSVLDKLLARGSLSGDQYHAGARYYYDWYASGLAASGVVDMQKPMVDNSPKPDPTLRLAAQTRYAHATKALGMVAGHAITALVLAEEGVEGYGRRMFGYKNKKDCTVAAIAALRIGLDLLDEHYNGKRNTRYQAGHVEGYRPTIQATTSCGKTA